ncbi:GGDEF domain-containing protein [Veronia nyctiphanis]|uniref:GGDEF domain-containing protein n=1 Tax=Veronia nyctiphanis TaxID=1278244 RepID=UPI001F267421|nr:GGDEF domain-containing protein [Veronia nyctiphanis]
MNDTYGHDVGDKAIKAFAQCIKEGVRESDVLFRWGGEEFLIVLRNPEDTVPDISKVLERVCRKVEAIDIDGVPKFTVSIGYCEYHYDDDIDDAIKNADTALYAAKHSGRNRVFRYNSGLKMNKPFVPSA